MQIGIISNNNHRSSVKNNSAQSFGMATKIGKSVVKWAGQTTLSNQADKASLETIQKFCEIINSLKTLVTIKKPFFGGDTLNFTIKHKSPIGGKFSQKIKGVNFSDTKTINAIRDRALEIEDAYSSHNGICGKKATQKCNITLQESIRSFNKGNK